MIEERLQAREHARWAIGGQVEPFDEVGPWQVEALFGNGLAAVLEQGDRICSQNLFYGSHAADFTPIGGRPQVRQKSAHA